MPNSIDRIAHRVITRLAAERIASRYLYAKLFLAMSLQEAKVILGFPPQAFPTADEITKAYRRKAIENHPDRGGSHEKMVEVNVAKDILDGKSRATFRPEPPPPRPKPPPPKEPDEVLEGQSFEDAMGNSGVPAGVEWKFISVPEWYWEKSFYPSHRIWVLYGQTDEKHVFLAFKQRGESSGTVPTDKGNTKIMKDWQSSEIDVPISQNIAKIAAKYIKLLADGWTDVPKMPTPKKYIAWSGGKPTEVLVEKTPRSGGAALKDILAGTGLLNDDDPTIAGRKSVVEVFTKTSMERYNRCKKLKAEGKIPYVTNAHQYDFFVRVNGKTEQLEDETIEKMIRVFIPFVLSWEISEGAPKNLTRMRGGRLKIGPKEAIAELLKCLTGEPAWLKEALKKAFEEYPEST